jgi:hypothetical protein
MKTRFMIIIGFVLIISFIGIVILNHYVSEREFELNNTPDQLEAIFGLCACQERVKANPDTIERCPEPFIDWQNSTHYIDNNICEWRKIENEN